MYFEMSDLSTAEYLYSLSLGRLSWRMYTMFAAASGDIKERRTKGLAEQRRDEESYKTV